MIQTAADEEQGVSPGAFLRQPFHGRIHIQRPLCPLREAPDLPGQPGCFLGGDRPQPLCRPDGEQIQHRGLLHDLLEREMLVPAPFGGGHVPCDPPHRSADRLPLHIHESDPAGADHRQLAIVQVDHIFRIMDGNSDDLIAKLRSGIISLAVITAPCNQSLLNSFSVGKEKMTAFMRRDNPLAALPGDTLEFCRLRDQPLIVPSRVAVIEMICKWFKEIGSEPRIVCEMDNYLDVAALAGRNVGISIFPKTSYVLNPDIVAKEIVEPERDIEYLFVWLKGRPLPRVEEAFIDHVRARLS